MNLGRARMILIVAFFGLNLFLAYHLFWPGTGKLSREAVTPEQVRYVREQLEQVDIQLEAAVDRTVPRSSFLIVFPGEERVEAMNKPLIKAGDKVGESELITAAEQYLRRNNLLPRQAYFDYVEYIDEETMILNYYHIFQNKPLYSSYLRVTLEKERIVALEKHWLNPQGWSSNQENKVIPATEALLRLAEEMRSNDRPRKVTGIDFGYYSREFDAEQWEVPPVWRIVVDGSECYYVNAFTGNLEIDLQRNGI